MEEDNMISANLKPEYKINEKNKDYYVYRLVQRSNNVAAKRYDEIVRFECINTAQYDKWNLIKNKGNSAVNPFANFDGAELIHDPRKKQQEEEKPKGPGRPPKTEK